MTRTVIGGIGRLGRQGRPGNTVLAFTAIAILFSILSSAGLAGWSGWRSQTQAHGWLAERLSAVVLLTATATRTKLHRSDTEQTDAQ